MTLKARVSRSVRRLPHRGAAGVLVATMLLAGCATPPPASDPEAYAEFESVNDPLEPFNRGVFEFNRGIDALFLKPFAEFYKLLLPPPVQTGIHNLLTNLRLPVTFFNNILQWDWAEAGNTAARFGINTTVGVAGFGDFATDWGFPYRNEDFGQTLATWGIGEGPFLMLPLLGPSNPRDAVGIAVDSTVLDPLGLVNTFVFDSSFTLKMISLGRLGLTAVDTRARYYDALNDLERNSLDFYASIRSLYRQTRRGEIYNGAPPAEAGAPPLTPVEEGID
jgi:Surface lipoprotein